MVAVAKVRFCVVARVSMLATDKFSVEMKKFHVKIKRMHKRDGEADSKAKLYHHSDTCY